MKMKAAVMTQVGKPVEIREVELAEPKAHEVLVKILATAVCHSDLNTLEDPTTPIPQVLGHEGAGQVVSVGPYVTTCKPGDYVTLLGFACKRGDGLKASRYQKPGRIFSACGGAALYRRAILDKIGVFDELFFAYYEDVDLSWRANNFGYKNVYCPTARCRHICGATTGAVRYNPFKSIQSGRNSILLPYKNQPALMLAVNFLPMALGYLLKVVMFRHRGFGNDYAKGYAEAKAALPKVDKPKFYWRNLPNYLWVEGSLIVGLFRYIVYRLQRALKIT